MRKTIIQRTIIITILLLTGICCFSQTNNLITIGIQDSIYSKLLNQNRQLLIYTPESMRTEPATRYPVIYLLDGEMYFHTFTGVVKQLQGSFIPEMIVVGIVNIDRNLDYTPTTDTTSGLKPNGGGDKFTGFLEKELFEFIEKKYPAAPYRMLVGHSLGGLFTANALLKHTPLFNSYLILDPALLWDNSKLVNEEASLLSQQKFKDKSAFLALANTLPEGMTIETAIKDSSVAGNGIRTVIKFNDILNKAELESFRSHFKYYENENHSSVVLLGSYDGLKFVFSFYKRPSFAVITDKSASILETHFKNVSKKMGFTILPPASIIGGLAWRCTLDKNFDNAFSFLEMYLRLYPSSPYPYYQMGQFYEARGDLKKAAEYYEKGSLYIPNTKKD